MCSWRGFFFIITTQYINDLGGVDKNCSSFDKEDEGSDTRRGVEQDEWSNVEDVEDQC